MRGPRPLFVAWPPDAPAWVALIAACLIAVFGPRLWRWWLTRSDRFVTVSAALAAFLLSLGYVVHYLRGGPRIIDATSYFLQARALAEGHFSWPIDAPTAEVRGRFLLSHFTGDGLRVGVIFPPGYPLLLAGGFLLGAPMLIGPLLAAATAWATFALARALLPDDPTAARLAVVFSVICAVLRYHTADTMSHGLAALLVTVSFLLAKRSEGSYAAALGAGFAWGWLAATRPLSAAAVAPALVWSIVTAKTTRPVSSETSRAGGLGGLVLFVAGSIPMIAFFLVEQHAVTGAWLTSSQTAYYALSDGPPGCFRLGFGPDIGCLHEHGTFVSDRFPDGFGPIAGTLTTLRRLRQHAVDLLNAEPLALFLLAGAWLGQRERGLRPLILTTAALPIAYLTFYYEGTYPGGGARLLADGLPIEHLLAAYGVSRLSAAFADAAPHDRRHRSADWIAPMSIAIALGGFGLRTAPEHASLAARDGGHPMFEAAVVARARMTHGLLWLDTDHGFDLGYDPDAHDADRQVVVARPQGDDRDGLLWQRLGRPSAFRYVLGSGPTFPALVAWTPAPLASARRGPLDPIAGSSAGAGDRSLLRFEAEAEWPPLAQSGGFFEVGHAGGTCASAGRVLTARPSAGQPLRGILEVPAPGAGLYRVRPRITLDACRDGVAARLTLTATPPASVDTSRVTLPPRAEGAPSTPEAASWTVQEQASGAPFRCVDLAPIPLYLSGPAWLEVEVRGSGLGLDAVSLEAESLPP